MARRRDSARLMIVATSSAQYGSNTRALEKLKHELRMRRLCCELCLPRLNRSATLSLLRAQLGNNILPDGLGDLIYRHSEGNPRFAIAILEHLISEKQLVQTQVGQSTEWHLHTSLETSAAPVPAEVARMIELEIEYLSPREQRLLEAASLSEVAFPAWAVSAALDEDLAQTEEACDDLARRLSFVRRAGEDELPDGTRSSFYAFALALYREVLYQRQSAASRALRHTRLATRLRQMFSGREELIAREAAAHYQAAGDWANVVAMLRLAARRALELRAFSEAAELEQQIARASANLPAGHQAHAEPDRAIKLAIPATPPAPRVSH
jgi:predicted ATPase